MTTTRGSQAAADVAALLRARNPLLWIVSREEARVERFIMEAAGVAQYEPRFWDCATGVTKFDGEDVARGAIDPMQMLNLIRDSKKREVWVLRDMPAHFRNPFVLRSCRSLARVLPMAPRDSARAVILITPSSDVPPELASHAIVIDWPLPDRSEIAAILDAAIAALPEELRDQAANNGARDAAIDAALGLTAEEAQSCYAKSLVSTRRIEPATVAAEKKRVIAREKVLEWFDPLPGGLDAVGGLDLLKDWLNTRRAACEAAGDNGWMVVSQTSSSVTIQHPSGGRLTVGADGKCDATGFCGSDCHATTPIENAIGGVSSRDYKPDYYDTGGGQLLTR